MTKVSNHQTEIRIQYIPMEKIEVPPRRRGLRNLTALVASIQRLRLLQPIVVAPMGPRYRVLDGGRRYHACQRLGWSKIPAIILSVEDQLAELIAIDVNLMREELTPSEQGEQRRRRRELSTSIYRQNTHRNSPRQVHRKDKQQEFSPPATKTPSKEKRTPRTIQQPVLIDIGDQRAGGGGRGSFTSLALRISGALRVPIPQLLIRTQSSKTYRAESPIHHGFERQKL